MASFTTKERTLVYERVLEIAKSDARVTGGAVVGSIANKKEDALSDIDLTFGIKNNIRPEHVLHDWTELLNIEFNTIHYFDIRHASAIYRVLLFPNCLELDLSVVPENDFGAITPNFQLLFGNSNKLIDSPKPDIAYLIGLSWHHVLHANTAIHRDKPWQAEYWISALRDHIISMKCIRLGLPSLYAKGADTISKQEMQGLESTLIKSLDLSELSIHLNLISTFLISEIQYHDEKLATSLISIFKKLFKEE
ncbi:MAG: hypothetical protein ABI844_17695 [Saprospiraceae bacterium]